MHLARCACRASESFRLTPSPPPLTAHTPPVQWYRRFADLLESSPDAPLEALAPLTNAPLLDGAGQLRPLLQEGSDVEIVPENAWRMLVDWFTGDHEIKRKVIAGAQPGNERVEFYVSCRPAVRTSPPASR